MARTTSAAVILLLSPGRDYHTITAPDLTPFIDTAAAVVDDVLECAEEKEIDISAARAELIERWLAAHFYKSSDQAYASKSTADASASYQGQTAMYLEGTKYGQTAVTLDPSGCLAAIAGAERASASLFWGGLEDSDKLDWDERN